MQNYASKIKAPHPSVLNLLSAAMASNYGSNAGILGVSAYLPVPRVPPIITEWSALFPLICHLANYGEDHQMVGELALAGHLTVGLFPKLGYLNGIWRLLEGGQNFLDRANNKDESKYKVWDVNWGSVFTSSNGAAISIITKYALRMKPQPLRMPHALLADPSQVSHERTPAVPSGDLGGKVVTKAPFRRYQILHVISMSRKVHAPSIRGIFCMAALSKCGEIAYAVILVGIAVLFCLLGAYGSAMVVLSGVVSKVVCRLLRVERPDGYLENNENHEACMLSAVHENASTWYLYIGDRGVVDWLLNKTMVSTPSAGPVLTAYFRLAHLSQLLAMTYVAAQKGVDGVSLVVLMLANHILQWLFGHHQMAREWLENEDVSTDAHTFEFSGRTPMLGAIHMLSAARDADWMDTLLAPCPRVKIWVGELKCNARTRPQLDRDLQDLSPSDRSWVLLNSQLAIEAARLISHKLAHEKAVMDAGVDKDS